jgi:hypothetical protein
VSESFIYFGIETPPCGLVWLAIFIKLMNFLIQSKRGAKDIRKDKFILDKRDKYV